MYLPKNDFDYDCGNIKKIATYLDECWEKRIVFIENVEKYLYLINGVAKDNVQTFLSKNHTLDEYTNYIIEFHETSLAIPNDIKPTVNIGIFKLNFTEIFNILMKQVDTFKDAIISRLKSVYQDLGNK